MFYDEFLVRPKPTESGQPAGATSADEAIAMEIGLDTKIQPDFPRQPSSSSDESSFYNSSSPYALTPSPFTVTEITASDTDLPVQSVSPSMFVCRADEKLESETKISKKRIADKPIMQDEVNTKKPKAVDVQRAFNELVQDMHIYDLSREDDKQRLRKASGINLCDLDDEKEKDFFIMAVPMLGFTIMQCHDATQQERVEFGLFSKKHFKKGDLVIPYNGLFRGPYQTAQEATKARAANAYRTIEFESNGLYWLCDSEYLSGAASYSNQLQEPNTKLVLDRRTGLAHLEATQDILPFEQISWTYGIKDKQVENDFEKLKTDQCSTSKILEMGIPVNDPRLSLITLPRTSKNARAATIDTSSLKEIVGALKPCKSESSPLLETKASQLTDIQQPELKQDFNFSCPTSHKFTLDQIQHQFEMLEQRATKDASIEIETNLLIAIARRLTPRVFDKWYTDPDKAIRDLANQYAQATQTRFRMISTFVQYNGKGSITKIVDSPSRELTKSTSYRSTCRFFNPKTVVISVESLKLLRSLFTSAQLTPTVKSTLRQSAVVEGNIKIISFKF